MKTLAAFLAGLLLGTTALVGLVCWSDENEKGFRR